MIDAPTHSQSSMRLIVACVALLCQCGDVTLALDPRSSEDAGDTQDDTSSDTDGDTETGTGVEPGTDSEGQEKYCTGATGVTYYVRPDGGNAMQCTGTENAAYPGDGEGVPCAFVHPSVAFTVAEFGDRIVIGSGIYEEGVLFENFGADGECLEPTAAGCAPMPVPSGLDADHPTCLVGEGWNDGCENPPRLTGVGFTPWLINLQNVDFVTVGCLELTDDSPCAAGHPELESNCEYLMEDPTVPVAGDGIFASNSAHITLRDLSIHGTARFGIYGQELADWHLDNVQLVANGNGGMAVLPDTSIPPECDALISGLLENAAECRSLELSEELCMEYEETVLRGMEAETIDFTALDEAVALCWGVGFPPEACDELTLLYELCLNAAPTERISSTGEMVLSNVTSSSNGCGELNGEIIGCYTGEHSSGLAVIGSAANWTVSSCTFTHNTRDGARITLADSNATVEISRTRLEGNAGAQLAVSGNAVIVNDIIAGNCNYYLESPFSTLVESCLNGGAALQLDLLSDQEVAVVNDTVWGEGDALVSVTSPEEGMPADDDGAVMPVSLSITAINSIFSGGIHLDGELPVLSISELYPAPEIQRFYNLFFQVNDIDVLNLCDAGSFVVNRCGDPLFASTEARYGATMDLNLMPSSSALDWGLPVDTFDIVPDIDFWGAPRPSGDGVDVGAVELPDK